LRFTFKDAMPAPHSSEIVRGNEEHFMFMRKEIRSICENAQKYMPGMREWVVLVSVPGWVEEEGDEGHEEEW
jgi:hypothetical protein